MSESVVPDTDIAAITTNTTSGDNTAIYIKRLMFLFLGIAGLLVILAGVQAVFPETREHIGGIANFIKEVLSGFDTTLMSVIGAEYGLVAFAGLVLAFFMLTFEGEGGGFRAALGMIVLITCTAFPEPWRYILGIIASLMLINDRRTDHAAGYIFLVYLLSLVVAVLLSVFVPTSSAIIQAGAENFEDVKIYIVALIYIAELSAMLYATIHSKIDGTASYVALAWQNAIARNTGTNPLTGWTVSPNLTLRSVLENPDVLRAGTFTDQLQTILILVALCAPLLMVLVEWWEQKIVSLFHIIVFFFAYLGTVTWYNGLQQQAAPTVPGMDIIFAVVQSIPQIGWFLLVLISQSTVVENAPALATRPARFFSVLYEVFYGGFFHFPKSWGPLGGKALNLEWVIGLIVIYMTMKTGIGY